MPPRQKPGRSKQDYQTPSEFLVAVRRKFGIRAFALDAAASEENAVCPDYFTEAMNALQYGWDAGGWVWCNPPYSNIRPWVRHAFHESLTGGVEILMLLPAGVGSNWWREWVHEKARVYLLNGRITFVGCDAGYPKDLVLLHYGPSAIPGYEVWTWPEPRMARRRIRSSSAADNGDD